jgi:transcriptional regulator with PAS, ATPase and Fis domain
VKPVGNSDRLSLCAVGCSDRSRSADCGTPARLPYLCIRKPAPDLIAAASTLNVSNPESDIHDPLPLPSPDADLDGAGHRMSVEGIDAFSGIITANAGMRAMMRTVELIAPTDGSILIWGESGTGKEVVARAVHRLSRRRARNFVAVNAGAVAEELFASDFFGHNRGAFTGAVVSRRGLLEEADHGTLFLDEIGELALPIQVKLLRVLQEGEFFRMGSSKLSKVDVRVIAATNKNLFEEMKNGNFRKDLFYRLNMNPIHLPPLKDRSDDLPLLIEHFLALYASRHQKRIDHVAPGALRRLLAYDYPGNVRELMNIIQNAVIVESTRALQERSLPQYFLGGLPTDHAAEATPPTLKDVEREHILKVLRFTGGNRTHAARILGISRINLIQKIKIYTLDAPPRRSPPTG